MDEAGVLARAQVVTVIYTTRKHKIVQGAAAPLKPSQKAGAGWFKQFELHWPSGFLLHDDRAGFDVSATHKITDLDLHHVAAVQLAVDGKIEQCSVADALLVIELKSDGPNLLRLQRTFGTKLSTSIPRTTILEARIKLRISHCFLL